MSKEREALKLALEALLESKPFLNDLDSRINHITAITSVKEALAQPEQKYTTTRNAWTGKATYKCNICGRDDFRSEHAAAFHECGEKAQPEQEPVAWKHPITNDVFSTYRFAKQGCGVGQEPVPLYTTPPQRKPLTDEQCKTLWAFEWKGERVQFIRAIEAAHGIKE